MPQRWRCRTRHLHELRLGHPNRLTVLLAPADVDDATVPEVEANLLFGVDLEAVGRVGRMLVHDVLDLLASK